MPQGNCRLCGEYTELTFEHVPPRFAFNKHTRYRLIPMMDYLKAEDVLNFKFKGKIEQGGVGYYSLCKKCNSFLGRNYVSAYTAYSNTFIEFSKKDFNFFSIIMHEFEAGKVLKQIVAMFLSMNDWEFSLNNRELAEFVLDVNSCDLPPKFRIFNYINIEGQLRNANICAIGNLENDFTLIGTEITYPPLGHVLTVDFKGKLPYLCEITTFKNYSANQKTDFDFNIYKLPTHLPILLDYRSKEAIIQGMSKH
jgi:hypothetical protein